ncbi:MAG: VOC family protein [Candidatus Hydrogenedens sp.]|nr:VOC family protein [Candidatus Hydrogenedens sp.]
MKVQRTIPILRIFDEALAREFYIDFLGFSVDFEHRFEEGLPLYMGISRAGCSLHLSGHFGDCAPGARVYLEVDDGLNAYQQNLAAKQYKHARPGVPCATPWGTREMTISDPFGNRLTFAHRVEQTSKPA